MKEGFENDEFCWVGYSRRGGFAGRTCGVRKFWCYREGVLTRFLCRRKSGVNERDCIIEVDQKDRWGQSQRGSVCERANFVLNGGINREPMKRG